MYKNETKRSNISIRTDYSQKRRKNKILRPNSSDTKNYNNYLLTKNTKNYYTNNINNYKNREIEKKPNYIKDPWSEILTKTSKEDKYEIKPNPKRYESNHILSSDHYYNGEKKHFKESSNYDYTTKTQITTLPGGVKRNKYEIKDDMYFGKPYNESRLYKMIHDYNYNVNYDQNYNPITQGYNINCFPIRQRFQGSYKRGMKDHDIFNTNFNRKYTKGSNDCLFRK